LPPASGGPIFCDARWLLVADESPKVGV
jgi:hypothetical protein